MARIPHSRVPVLQPDGSLTLPWRLWAQGLAGDSGVTPADITALEAAVAAIGAEAAAALAEAASAAVTASSALSEAELAQLFALAQELPTITGSGLPGSNAIWTGTNTLGDGTITSSSTGDAGISLRMDTANVSRGIVDNTYIASLPGQYFVSGGFYPRFTGVASGYDGLFAVVGWPHMAGTGTMYEMTGGDFNVISGYGTISKSTGVRSAVSLGQFSLSVAVTSHIHFLAGGDFSFTGKVLATDYTVFFSDIKLQQSGMITNFYGFRHALTVADTFSVANSFVFYDAVEGAGAGTITNRHGFYQAATNHPNFWGSATTFDLVTTHNYLTASKLAGTDASKNLASIILGSGLSLTSGTLSNTGVLALTQGAGITISGSLANETIANAGVIALTAGTGISLGGTLANETINNSGVVSLVAGTNVSLSGATGTVTVNVTGVGSGSVTSVKLASTNLAIGGTNPVTTSGTITADLTAGIGLTFGSTGTISLQGALPNGQTATTQAAGDASTKVATDAFVSTAIANAIAGVNPAVAVRLATAAILPNSPVYFNGVGGIGATITAGVTNTALVVDGVTPVLNDRILVKNEASGGGLGAADNGVYFVSQVAALGLAWVLTRALDYDQPSDINSTGAIPVVAGTANVSTTWVLTSSVTTIGTDALTYTQFSFNPAVIFTMAGTGLTGTGTNTVAISSIVAGGSVTNATVTFNNQGQITAASSGTAPPAAANPSATIGTVAANGVATTFMRSDAAPALTSIVAAGTVTNATVTFNAAGQITAASSGTAPPAVTVVNAYTTNGSFTWNKPAGAIAVRVYALAAGGGGGAGSSGASGTVRAGGGGGAGGGYIVTDFQASDLAGSVTVTVGKGGTVGAGAVNTPTGANGGNGGNSSFGTAITARGGNGGTGGTTTGLGGASNTNMSMFSTAGGGTGGTTAGGSQSGASVVGGGGGGGAGANTTGTANVGGAGAVVSLGSGSQTSGGNTSGTGGGAAGAPPSTMMFGCGGGGGGTNGTTTAGNGSTGTTGCGGGGGGGIVATVVASGSGGAGGDGAVVVVTYF